MPAFLSSFVLCRCDSVDLHLPPVCGPPLPYVRRDGDGILKGLAPLAAVEETVGIGVETAAVVGDGVHQTAGAVAYGQGAVAHGDELGQAAGLEETGNQEGVRARVDQMGHGFIVGDLGADKPLILSFFLFS